MTRVGQAKKAVAAATLANIDPPVPQVTVQLDIEDFSTQEVDGRVFAASHDSEAIGVTTAPLQEVEFVLLQVMTEVTVAIAAKIMQAAKKKNARDLKRKMKEAEEADGENLVSLEKKLKLALQEKKLAKATRDKQAVREKLARAIIYGYIFRFERLSC